MNPPSIAEIEAAAVRLAGHAVVTPLLSSPLLDDRLGGRLLIKAEPLQRTGSFKYRGAFNRISLIPEAERGRGVVAYSSGNHAQGVAAAARDLGLQATIVMPADSPAIKLRNTHAWGARVVTYDRHRESREEIGAALTAETGATLVKPYDDPGVIAGQGTVGLELAAQAAALGLVPEAVLVPASGGGLLAGIALAVAARLPGCPVWAVEPAGYDDTARSLAAGRRLAITGEPQSFCDALLMTIPGEITFEINQRRVAGGLVVSDGEVAAAMAVAFDAFKLVVEPGGAVALAAVLSGKIPCRGRTLAVVCSGGNVDPAVFAAALAAPAPTA
ncbi:MAG: pyridoxal-phosphate dependent enzyme [Azospirillum sp.]|nr:pyridoxal-phosphate dependent enzyme [Azospirillum sp.]